MLGQSAKRTSYKRFGSFRIGIACGLMIMGSEAWGAPVSTNQVQASAIKNGEDAEDISPAAPDAHENNIIDAVQGSTSSRIVTLARWVDSFFDDPEYAVQEATARASINQDINFYRNLDPSYRTYVRASAVLPNLNRKFRLIFEGDNDPTTLQDTEDIDPDTVEPKKDSVDDNTLRLQYIFLERYYLDLRLTGGIRLKETDLYIGPRVKFRTHIGSKWEASLSQRIYWYTTNTLRTKTELRFDHILGEHNLFRQAFSTDWDEEKHQTEGFRNTVTSSITQPIKRSAAFRYAWSSSYQTRPDPRWTSTTLSVGYRQSVWRDWIIVEVTPFVTWEEDFNWDPKPGFTIALSAIFEG